MPKYQKEIKKRRAVVVHKHRCNVSFVEIQSRRSSRTPLPKVKNSFSPVFYMGLEE
jgi:hypothetical protein